MGLLTAVELMCEEVMQKELLLITLETVSVNRVEHIKEEVELVVQGGNIKCSKTLGFLQVKDSHREM